MYKFIIKEKGKELRDVPVEKSRLNIGRDTSNDIALEDDSVSACHFSVYIKRDKVLLKDEDSLNGTFVGNSRDRVKTAELKAGDIIRVGHTLIKLVQVPDAPPVQEFVRRQPPREAHTIVASNIRLMEKELDSVEARLGALRASGAGIPAGEIDSLSDPFVSARNKLSEVGKSYDRLSALYEASKYIISGFDLEQRLNLVMDAAIDVLQAERGFLMLKNDQSDELKVVVKRKIGGEELDELSLSMSVAAEVARTGESRLTSNAAKDPFFRDRGSIIMHKIVSIMCVPLKIEERVLGVIYLDNRISEGVFDESDKELFSAFASLSAIAIENARLFQKLQYEEKIRATMSRNLPTGVVEMLMKNPEDWKPGGTLQKVTVLFSDIRGFTRLSAGMPPDTTMAMLNEYFDEMSKIIFAHQGTLDKFMGDGIMAIFGAPFSYGDDADRAVQAAVDMIQRVQILKERARETGKQSFDIGIGVNTGAAIAGNVGTLERMDYTVIGDMVNTAFRLTSAAGRNQILISKETKSNLQAVLDLNDMGRIKTKDVVVEAYEVIVPPVQDGQVALHDETMREPGR
ncbi:MAG: FHA domain-containing protein [Candidatus Abyssobacteria bacterium SURF_5]|uniref:FHA domain-containing protein n=1 Tax=Abyssobacteria bacterium (strain SURF_5) TaxID=2093360 RepID=A0A3A4MYL7_ABYX5|nr:MAG: FHA domain-containing protein [Candidatus Abyssubacteria bacterium SURF_5]